jgi:recombinational DNA repair protein RecT
MANGYDHPWISSYAEMGKKTAIRRGSKMWPASTDKDNLFQKLNSFDELQDKGITADASSILDVEIVSTAEVAIPSQADEGKREKLADKPADASA